MLGTIQSVVYLLVGLATGVTLVSGVAGALVLLALSVLISFAFASLGGLLALRFGTGEAVQGIFPLLFVTLFLSSSSLPRNLIKARWFRDVATYNPVSYLIEALRSLVITGWDAQALALGFGFSLVLLVVTLALSDSAMKTRAGADDEALPLCGPRSRLALDPQHARQPGDPRAVDHLSAVLPGRVRGWPVADRRHPELPLPTRLHGVPVRLRVPAVSGVRGRLHRLCRRSRLRLRLRPAADAERAAPQRDHRRLCRRRARCAGHSPAPWSRLPR